MHRFQTVAAVVVAGAALSTATACGSSDDTATATQSGSASSPPSASSSASASGLAPARRAVRTAERKVRRGDAYDIERDRLRGRRVWEVKVARGSSRPYELDVRADGRKVLRQRRRSKVGDDVHKVGQARVSLNRALKIAGRRARGGRFDEAEIDRWRGRIVWEATFERSRDREVEVKVDARNGRVLAVTTDD